MWRGWLFLLVVVLSLFLAAPGSIASELDQQLAQIKLEGKEDNLFGETVFGSLMQKYSALAKHLAQKGFPQIKCSSVLCAKDVIASWVEQDENRRTDELTALQWRLWTFAKMKEQVKQLGFPEVNANGLGDEFYEWKAKWDEIGKSPRHSERRARHFESLFQLFSRALESRIGEPLVEQILDLTSPLELSYCDGLEKIRSTQQFSCNGLYLCYEIRLKSYIDGENRCLVSSDPWQSQRERNVLPARAVLEVWNGLAKVLFDRSLLASRP